MMALSDKVAPSNSRSQNSFSLFWISVPSNSREGRGVGTVSPHRSNMVDCPDPLRFHSLWDVAKIFSTPPSSAPRSARESSAPTFIRLSNALLFKLRRSARRQRSSTDLKGPPSSLASRTDITAPVPTFFTAESPNLMAWRLSSVSSMVKSNSERLRSGGRTGIPRFWHSATAEAVLSDCPRWQLSRAVMNSAG